MRSRGSPDRLRIDHIKSLGLGNPDWYRRRGASRLVGKHLYDIVGYVSEAAHQGWSANLFTTTSDMFPRQAVGSVVGIGGMAGAIGGMLIAKIVGYILQSTGSYVPIFFIAGSAYLLALAIIQLLAPRLEPAPLDAAADLSPAR